MRAESINRFFNGLPFVVLLAVILALTGAMFAFSGNGTVNAGGGGFCFSSANLHIADKYISLGINLATILLSGILLYYLNKSSSFIRAYTLIHISSFFMLEAANPYLSSSLLDGSFLSLILLGATFILFNSYNMPRPQRSIFLTFTLLALGSMFHYMCLFLIPVFFIGFIQMRAMSLKGFLAMGVGLATPFWILMGTGIVKPTDFALPAMHNVWSYLNSMQSLTMLLSVILSAIIVIILMSINLFQIYSYKTQIRSYNGFFSILTIATLIIMAIDYGNILNYIPVLNCCLAVQIAHSFTISKASKRFIAYMIFIAVCIVMFGLQFFSININ